MLRDLRTPVSSRLPVSCMSEGKGAFTSFVPSGEMGGQVCWRGVLPAFLSSLTALGEGDEEAQGRNLSWSVPGSPSSTMVLPTPPSSLLPSGCQPLPTRPPDPSCGVFTVLTAAQPL